MYFYIQCGSFNLCSIYSTFPVNVYISKHGDYNGISCHFSDIEEDLDTAVRTIQEAVQDDKALV